LTPGTFTPDAETGAASPVVKELQSGAAAPNAEHAVVSPSVEDIARVDDLPATAEARRFVEGAPETRQHSRAVEIRAAAAAEPPKLSSSSSMIFMKRRGETARGLTKSSVAESDTAESGAAQEMAGKPADPARGDDLTSSHPSTIVSPGAQTFASVTETESGANPDAARLLTIKRVSPSVSSEIINRSELKQPPPSQAAAQLIFQNSAALKSEETREKAVDPLTMDETEVPGALGSTQLPFRSGIRTHPEPQEAAIEREGGAGFEAASVQMSGHDSETALPLVPSRQGAAAQIVSRSVSSHALASPPRVNQPAAPSRMEHFAQGERLGASASTENSASDDKQSSLPAFAREMRESSSRMAEPAIIWRTSHASTLADQSVGTSANGTTPLVLRQAENLTANEQPQSEQAIVPPAAAAEQARGGEVDVGQITRSVIRSLSRRLAVERERRGIVK
jgi:hypothetical protein